MKWRFLFCFSLFFLSCQVQEAVPESTLRMVLKSEPSTLNPLTGRDLYSSIIEGFYNDTLIKRDLDTLEFKPMLAEKWEVGTDGLSYTFYLRKDVLWHDGKPFTADDVVYSFERILDPEVDAPHVRGYFLDAGIAKIEKVDDYTVKFIATKPYFLGLGVCGGLSLVPKHVFNNGTPFNYHPANRSPVGVGPYRFKEWKTGRKIVLERFDKYWGEKPDIKTLEFRLVSDDTIVLHALKKNELDVADLEAVQWMKQLGDESSSTFNRYKTVGSGYRYIGWNPKVSLFSDKKVRQALTYLINRNKILEKVEFGLANVVIGPFYTESSQYNKNIKPYPYDPVKGRKLLAEAGWKDSDGDGILDKDGKKFEFTFLYAAESTQTERMAPIIKEDLKNAGILMKIERMEWGAFVARVQKKDFEATSLGWSSGFETDPYQIWHSSQSKIEGGSNFISFENAEADKLIEQARVTLDEKKRNELYWKFQEILHEEQPYTFLFSSFNLDAVSKRVTNVIVHKAGFDIREWKIP